MDETRIIELSEKRTYTEEDKEEIRTEAEARGLEIRFGGKCPNCYRDAVIMLRAEIRTHPSAGGRKWKYLRSEAQIWDGNIMDGNTPDGIIEKFVELFPQFYERMEAQNEANSDTESEQR